ncbi:carbohydrate kinase family protein [Candidatus Entotheonella palauensis]|uniref:carbohydrate kinase family protein n=1 Tax=Candidatus Entotheonella palauensis TaxID=93172 RepID=UPI0015C48B9D|nr:carbohydrate kinase family protein [Candidatus Entotheonella palauensis]
MPSVNDQIGVIGTASFDILHVDSRVVHTIGGAGLYTALAAHRAGANTHLIAPRPEPLPQLFAPVAERVQWIGPMISPEALPRLEIEHHGQGRATLLDASWGAEAELTPAAIPLDKQHLTILHIAALSSAKRQLEFVWAIHATDDGGGLPRISVGTYARLVDREIEVVRQLFQLTDCFFMNENEALGLFGTTDRARTRPDALLCVTLGNQGVLVIEGDRVTHVPAHAVDERDPTGAGDTFCGGTLAGLAMGLTPVAAAERAVALAARTVSDIGPASLLQG